MPRGRGDNARTTFGRPAPKILGWPRKRPNFGAIFDNFRLWSRISPERILNIWEKNLINQNHFHIERKKALVNFGPQTKKFYWLILTNPRGHFSGDCISAIRGCCHGTTWNFYTRYRLTQLPSSLAHPQHRRGPPKKFNRENSKFDLKFRVWASITSGLVGISSPKFSRQRGELWSTNEKRMGTDIDTPEVLLHCKLTQFHLPRGSRVPFRGHSAGGVVARGISNS